MRGRGAAACAVAVAFWLGGCTGGSDGGRDAGGTTEAVKPSASPRSPAPTLLDDVSQCARPGPAVIPAPSAPAYAGKGPHRVVIGEFPDVGEPLNRAGGEEFDVPETWVSFDSIGLVQDLSHAQLVVCLTGLRRTGTAPVGSCDYEGARADVFPARFTYEVFEARTGRRVGRTTMDSDETFAQASCPASVLSVAGGTAPVAQSLRESTFRAWLRPFVLGPAK